MTQVRRQITIIVSRKSHSVSPFDWGLGFEGLASEDDTNTKCQLLLGEYCHVKVFSAGKLVREHLRRGSTRLKTDIPIGTTNQLASAATATSQGHTSRPQESIPIAESGVRLRIGDRVKVGGHTYRVCKVTESYAIAIPKGAGRHLKALKIAPPMTSSAVRLKANMPVTPMARTAVRVPPKQKRKRPVGSLVRAPRRGRVVNGCRPGQVRRRTMVTFPNVWWSS